MNESSEPFEIPGITSDSLNTRFNPTTNGELHLGHAFMALLNRDMAHSTDGAFTVRFDDNCRYWNHRMDGTAHPGPTVAAIQKQMRLELEWLGIAPDVTTSQWLYEDETRRWLARYPEMVPPDHFPHTLTPDILNMPVPGPMGCTTYVIFEKVVLDYVENTNCVIRGYEFISDFSLYVFLCYRLGFPVPWLLYVPRLRTDTGGELSDISKTRGNFKLSSLYKAGVPAESVLALLREACLVDPAGLFVRDNLKLEPAVAQVDLNNL